MPLEIISFSGSFSGLGRNLRGFIWIGVGVGEFSRSSGSVDCMALDGEDISIPLLLRAAPFMPLFLGDAERGGGRTGAPRDLRADSVWVGVSPEPIKGILPSAISTKELGRGDNDIAA